MLQGFENLWWEEMLKAGVALEEGQQCGSWIVWDGVQVVDKVHRLNKYTGGTKARMAVYDFKTMYTCIPLDDLTDRMHKLIREVFVKRNQHVLGSQWPTMRMAVTTRQIRVKVGAERSAEAEYEMVADSGCRSSMFNVVKTGYLYLHQARRSCVVAKNRHSDGHQLRSIFGQPLLLCV